MFFRAVDDSLGGSHNRDGILIRKTLHYFLRCAFFQEGQAGRAVRAEEDINKRKDLFDTFFCFCTGPEISTEVYIKGDQSTGLFETTHHFNGCLTDLLIQGKCDSAGVEAACGMVHFFRKLINGKGGHGASFTVVNNAWFSWSGTTFVVVDTKTCVCTVVAQKIFIAYILEMDFISCKLTDSVGRDLSHKTGF